ncbi:MAG: hypothetical protein HOK97_09230, partial [Deltaproteobacteria bacterium]|nr:hypothetical protein [Deltaproteobacteria bacterium]
MSAAILCILVQSLVAAPVHLDDPVADVSPQISYMVSEYDQTPEHALEAYR